VRALFLDRDGTLIEERHYLADPEGVQLLPGAGEALSRIGRAGIPTVLVTNQSGIGRGLYGEEEFRAVQRRVEEELAAHGARLSAVYHCPHAPDADPPCDCRKPLPGLFRRAARDLDLELEGSWFVGDRLRDVLPGLELGGRAALLTIGDGGEVAPEGVPVFSVWETLADAVLADLTAPEEGA
jgi:D-glycero-D-manno-heptose 1,7-bisphosphate phosphatase